MQPITNNLLPDPCYLKKQKNRSLLNGLYFNEYVFLRGKNFLQEENFQRV